MPFHIATRNKLQVTHTKKNNESRVSCYLLPAFTLIEFLVVLGVLSITVGSALLVLTSVLRGTNQANISAEVKQNGQAVLGTLESQIRNATDARDLSPLPPGANDGVSLTLGDGTVLNIACFAAGANTNGYIGTSTGASYTSMTNQDLISGVDVDNCNLGVVPASVGGANSAIVSFSFVMNQGKNAPSRQDFVANVRFETTIALRKY